VEWTLVGEEIDRWEGLTDSWSQVEESFEGRECHLTILLEVVVGIEEELDFVAGVVGVALNQGRRIRKGRQILEALAETNSQCFDVAQVIETT